MPIDPMLLDSILGTFKNMVEDCRQKEISGEDFDAMAACYERMEELGQSHDDIVAFSGAMMQENMYVKFSDHYSRALVAHSQQSTSSGGDNGYDDAALLKQNINALKGAVKLLEDNYKETLRMASAEHNEAQNEKGLDYLGRTQRKAFDAGGGFDAVKKQIERSTKEAKSKTPNRLDSTVEIEVLNNPDALIKPILNLIELGEQPGMTFPKFLRLQIETGLDKAMEGTGVVRDGLVYGLDFAKAIPANPYTIEIAKRKLESFDKLASCNRFKVPDVSELNYAHDDIDREFEPKIRQWNSIKRIWESMIGDLIEWSLSYCHFAPEIEPWSFARNPKEATLFDQNVSPGIFKEREKQLQEYFGMSFMDIFKHPSFEFEVKMNYFDYSQEIIEFLIEEVYPHCRPFNHLPAEVIKKRGMFTAYMRSPGDLELNPDLHLSNQRLRDFYNSKFGEGYFESKYPVAEKNPNAFAKPWEWETFKYGG